MWPNFEDTFSSIFLGVTEGSAQRDINLNSLGSLLTLSYWFAKHKCIQQILYSAGRITENVLKDMF